MPPTVTPIKRNFLTVSQAATRLGLAERTILRYIATGQLRAEPLEPEKPSSVWIIPLAEIERFEKQKKSA